MESRRFRTLVLFGVLGWYLAITALRRLGFLEGRPGSLPVGLLLAATVPVALFLAAFAAHGRFRALALSLDPGTLTLLQAWRIGGFCFLPLWAHGVLPGLFAIPAGVGDAAVGLTAPLVYFRFVKRPRLSGSGWFRAWHLVGLLDVVVAIAANAAASGAFPALVAGPVTSAPTTTGVLSVIPTFFVPLFAILHLIVLLRAGSASPPSR